MMRGKKGKRIRSLILICALTAVILTVSTYAWFIGMQVVNVSSFDIEIASTDSLILSLDGETWDTTVNISQALLDDVSYDNHTNSWGGSGLLPMSSVGDMDVNASRLKLFEKASLTATPGGYRLLASRVNNYQENADEQRGYVAFDLFVRNMSGTQYIKTLNTLDEEAIYLTTDSKVEVLSDGVANTGIENSVRVAFAQIGRVSGITTDPDIITGITCESDEAEIPAPSIKGAVTGICRRAQIWEPNDKAHVVNAISWYNTSCLARTKLDITDPLSYSGACGIIANDNAYHTYAVNSPITSANNVDVYDGADYNKYGSTTLLTPYDYFTDSEKILTGTDRPAFMTLAPNSITKIRIYVYIEGQDVDNYDFASIGKKIWVQFGFTKERFTEDDIDYNENNGPALNDSDDTVKPVITLLGNATVSLAVGATYEEAGATANDDVDGDITRKIEVINPVDTTKAGTYIITYNVRDWAGNYAAQVTRTVTVQ